MTHLLYTTKGPRSLLFDFNNVKARYLIVNVAFSAVPYSYHKKEEESAIVSEIFPIVYGMYVGEAEALLSSKFDFLPENMHLVKKVDQFTKYSLKHSENTSYYTSEEDVTTDKNKILKIEDLRQKEDSPANRQAIVNVLMQKPSRDNLNFRFTLSYLLIDLTI